MSISLSTTVLQVINLALSKIGIDGTTTEAKTIEDAHRNLNLILGSWSSDPDLAVQRLIPVTGYANLTDPVDLPPEYVHALVLFLAITMCDDFDQPVSKTMGGMAQEALNNIKIFNIRRIGGRIPTNGVLG